MTLTEAQRKAAEMYRDGDNSLSFICAACGLSNKSVYQAIDALKIPRRTTAKRSPRHRIAFRRKAAGAA